jgi:hypothetical protein
MELSVPKDFFRRLSNTSRTQVMLSAEICWKFYQVIRVASDIPRRDIVSLDSSVLYQYSGYCLLSSILEIQPKNHQSFTVPVRRREASHDCVKLPRPPLTCLHFRVYWRTYSTVLGPRVELFPTRLLTSEDECKWF